MGVELTTEQLQTATRGAVHVRDPETRQEYVLLPAEVYARLQSLLADVESQQAVREMFPYLAEVFGKEGWDDPAMDCYNESQPPAQS